jgi:hypothetical protein
VETIYEDTIDPLRPGVRTPRGRISGAMTTR